MHCPFHKGLLLLRLLGLPGFSRYQARIRRGGDETLSLKIKKIKATETTCRLISCDSVRHIHIFFEERERFGKAFFILRNFVGSVNHAGIFSTVEGSEIFLEHIAERKKLVIVGKDSKS